MLGKFLNSKPQIESGITKACHINIIAWPSHWPLKVISEKAPKISYLRTMNRERRMSWIAFGMGVVSLIVDIARILFR